MSETMNDGRIAIEFQGEGYYFAHPHKDGMDICFLQNIYGPDREKVGILGFKKDSREYFLYAIGKGWRSVAGGRNYARKMAIYYLTSPIENKESPFPDRAVMKDGVKASLVFGKSFYVGHPRNEASTSFRDTNFYRASTREHIGTLRRRYNKKRYYFAFVGDDENWTCVGRGWEFQAAHRKATELIEQMEYDLFIKDLADFGQ